MSLHFGHVALALPHGLALWVEETNYGKKAAACRLFGFGDDDGRRLGIRIRHLHWLRPVLCLQELQILQALRERGRNLWGVQAVELEFRVRGDDATAREQAQRAFRT